VSVVLLLQAPLNITALGGWWMFGWIAFALITYWSIHLRIVLGTRAALLLWLPQLTLIFVGGIALLFQRSRVLRVEPDLLTLPTLPYPPY